MTIDTKVNYDFDVVIWDTVGGAYTPESMRKASGGSEKEVVQLAEALAGQGFHVLCLNQTTNSYGPVGRSEYVNTETGEHHRPGHWRWENTAYVRLPQTSPSRPLRCRTLIVQRHSTLPGESEVLADRIVVRATDVYGTYHDHLQGLTHVCVSEWQAAAFKAAGFSTIVIPAMLDDDYYELAKTPKVKGRFIYASAAMKGLKETIAKWRELRVRFPEVRACELQITSPGYGHVGLTGLADREWCEDHGIHILDDLSPRELAKYMATCEGLFYVNTFPETFCAVAAIAEAVGCRPHILAKNGLSGIPEAAYGYVLDHEWTFDETFIKALEVGPNDKAWWPWNKWTPHDFRVSTVMPQWLNVLRLGVTIKTEPVAAPLPPWPPGQREYRKDLTPAQNVELAAMTTYPTMPDVTTKKDIEPTVCLVMLAKNAETTIRRAIESVKDFVDYAVFQFDSEESSQAMRSTILEVWPHHETSIPVEFTYAPWVNFRENRNRLLDDAREAAGKGYVLTLDADDEFTGLNPEFKSRLVLDCYEVEISDFGNTVRYPRRMLWKNDGRFRYEGVAHEFLTEGANVVTTGRLQGVQYIRKGGPPLSVEQTRAKYLRDVRLFSAELRKNPEDTRSAYYLAQSLEDAACGDDAIRKQALRAYEKRMAMDGFIQEKFVAAMKVGRFRKALTPKDETSIVGAFIDAARVLPERAIEAVYEIMLYYNNEGGSKSKAVEADAKFAPKNFTPPEGFIVDVTVYAWQYRFQLAIALYYVGRKEEAKAIFEDLLTVAPSWEHAVIRSNLAYCNPAVRVDSTFLDELDAAYGEKAPSPLPVDAPLHGGFSDLGGPAELRRAVRVGASVPWFTPRTATSTEKE